MRIYYSYKKYPYSERATELSRDLAKWTSGPVILLGGFLWMMIPMELLGGYLKKLNDGISTVIIIAFIAAYIFLIRWLIRRANKKILEIAMEDYLIAQKKTIQNTEIKTSIQNKTENQSNCENIEKIKNTEACSFDRKEKNLPENVLNKNILPEINKLPTAKAIYDFINGLIPEGTYAENSSVAACLENLRRAANIEKSFGNNKVKAVTEVENYLVKQDKEAIYNIALEKMAHTPPSERFVSGVVFDAVQQHRETLNQYVRSNDVLGLSKFFMNAYVSFINNPGVFGGIPCPLKVNNDSNPTHWNMEVCPLSGEDKAILCYIPIQNDTLSARMFGIIFSSKGDGYYYCMIDKDEHLPSTVKRNMAIFGVKELGKIEGRGFDLRDNFLECIKTDFYSTSNYRNYHQDDLQGQ